MADLSTQRAHCGCDADPGAAATPRNRPGQAAISHRPGTYGSFLAGMHRALARQPGLRGLTTRDPSDPAIALIEAWAAVADVLAFQGERLAQEGYLRTASTRDAVLLHARALGYELRPGVAAATFLALQLQLPPDAPDSVALPPGVAVQSVPGPGEQPQIFETVEELVAVRGLDDLRPALADIVVPEHGDDEVVLAGTATGLRPGDRLLMVGAERLADPGSERWDMRRVVGVTTVDAEVGDAVSQNPGVPAHTVVRLESPLGSDDPWIDPASEDVEIHVLRQGVPLFGHAAPPYDALPVALRVGELSPGTTTVLDGAYKCRKTTWVDAALPSGTSTLELSRRVDGLVPDSWAVIADPGYAEVLRITGVTEKSLADYTLTAEASVLEISGEHLQYFDRRSALVWCVAEQLDLGPRPTATPIEGTEIELGKQVQGLSAGRVIVVEGARTDTGEAASEVATVHAVSDVAASTGELRTRIVLEQPLAHAYIRDTVHVLANVVPATHGQSRGRDQPVVLGSGDGAHGFQRFVLPESPLTHVDPALAEDPSAKDVLRGAASTLEVRVDGMRWRQVDTLHGQPPDARVFTARARPGDGRIEVAFGDGVTGARLPTGRDNVTAAYRVGTGLAGQVDAEQLTLLLSRPLGLAGTRNPLPAGGAADPESRDDARRNAPVAVRTLDRVVSLVDVADLARTYGGISKAEAAWLWVGDERVVHVTVVPSDGSVLASGDPLLVKVADAIDAARHPGAAVLVEPHVPVPVALRGGIVVHPDFVESSVLEAARTAVAAAFTLAARDLAQPLAASEILAVLHQVEGLVAVDLDEFHQADEAPSLQGLIPSRPATVTSEVVTAAELVWVAATAVDLDVVTP